MSWSEKLPNRTEKEKSMAKVIRVRNLTAPRKRKHLNRMGNKQSGPRSRRRESRLSSHLCTFCIFVSLAFLNVISLSMGKTRFILVYEDPKLIYFMYRFI